MTALPFVIASLLANADMAQCSMNPPPLAVEVVKASKDVKSFVVVNPKTMSILLKDGTLIRVVSMGCTDSGSVARVWINNPPSVEDMAAWKKLFLRIASVAFDHGETKRFATWLPQADFTRRENGRSVLSAAISDDLDLSVKVESLSGDTGAEITMSFTYH